MWITNTEVFGFKAAIRGMRNPMNSWEHSDSTFTLSKVPCAIPEGPMLGLKDLTLTCKLIQGGTVHRKFLRQIMIWTDIEAPRYVWQELDTYKVATVRNSYSTMHKLGSRDLTKQDFEDEQVLPDTLKTLNSLRIKYNMTRDYVFVRKMKSLLPEGFLQKATYTMSYETALHMFISRKDHRLSEWCTNSPKDSICKWIIRLPYMDNFVASTQQEI